MENVRFSNKHGLTIAGLFVPGERAVAISHGFLSFKENKLLYRIAQALEKIGIGSLRFDFSGCVGASQGSCSEMMLTHELDDVEAALTFLESRADSLGLVGHSLGGLASLITATRDPRVKSLVTVGAPANMATQRVFSTELARMWEHDRIAVFKSRKGEVEIGYSFYRDLASYDGAAIAKQLTVPYRVIHGNGDSTVLPDSAELLHRSAGGKKDLQLIGGDHLFLDREGSEKVAALVAGWMRETL